MPSLELLPASPTSVLYLPDLAVGGVEGLVGMDWGKPLADCCGDDVGGAPASFTFLNAAL